MRQLLSALLWVATLSVSAQNVQVHYDFGKQIYSEESDRANVTLSYEHFTVDKNGSWFYFVDIDVKEKGVSGAYTEVSRTFNLGRSIPTLHFEYNGGINEYSSFANSFLGGLDYSISDNVTLSLLYRQELKQKNNPQLSTIQITGVWNYPLGKFMFCGFVDVWNSYIPKWNEGGQEKGWIVLAEPQLWYNFNNVFSIGTEIRVSNNFVYPTKGNKTIFINPTIAVKYNL